MALLDIRMPGLDGLTILRRARAGGLETPLIVMTAHGDSNTAIVAMKSGAFDYILKPLDFSPALTADPEEPSSIGVWQRNSALFVPKLPLTEWPRRWLGAVRRCSMFTN